MSDHLTTQELDAARAKYRAEIIPVPALAVIDAEIEVLRVSGFEDRALKRGRVAPDFMLPDPKGRLARLHSLLSQGPVVLVFYRGAWCPYCNLHLRGLQRALPRLKEFGAQVVAVSPQLPDNSLSTQEKYQLTFPVLSDVGNKVASRFGIVFHRRCGVCIACACRSISRATTSSLLRRVNYESDTIKPSD
jgi:peroxiredoxin